MAGNKEKDFEDLKNKVYELYARKRLKEALRLLEKRGDDFPHRLYEILWFRVILYKETKNHRRVLAVLEEGLDQGFVFPIVPNWDFWIPFKRYKSFARLVEVNDGLRQKATAGSKPEYELKCPEGYQDGQAYPLLIALHGGDGTIGSLTPYWKSDEISRSWLTAFFQSAEVSSTAGFFWNDMERSRKDILALYEKVRDNYPVDEQQVVVGGFSQGGRMAMDVLFQAAIPARGFIVLFPGDFRESFDFGHARRAAGEGKKGVFIFNQKEELLVQKELFEAMFKETGFPCRFIPCPGEEHSYPHDFSAQLDEALAFLLD
jgi:hypothetical protein